MIDNCPNCGISFRGKEIPDAFVDRGYTREEAEARASAFYGWTPENKKCFYDIYIYVTAYNEDYSKKWKYNHCRACNHDWGLNLPPEQYKVKFK